MNRGSVLIIPDENKILGDVFYQEINKDHLQAMKEFSNKFKLGYKFNLDDYQKAPCMFAMDGHFVFKTIEDASIVICYMPFFVTDNQMMWLYDNQYKLSKYQTIGGYKIVSDGELIVDEIHSFKEIYNEASRRNIKYNKKTNKSRK